MNKKIRYCVFCGRYHIFRKRMQFPFKPLGMRRNDGKDGICSKGIIFVEELRRMRTDWTTSG